MIESIQVQTTHLTGAGVEMVSMNSNKANCWSIYVRDENGMAEWVEDIPIKNGDTPATSYTEVMVKAAKLSIRHKAFIEEIK